MAQNGRTCTRCGAPVAAETTRCSVCGAHPDVGPLVVRNSAPVSVLPVGLVARPLAVGAAVVAASAGLRLARYLMPRLMQRRKKAQPPAIVEKDREHGPIIAVRRRVWAIGNSDGIRHWGSDETVWHGSATDREP
ncbi:MAG: hypothetical protein U9R25_17780 [Chloroflexota bacterium]|nr:hypothetical protein [Chloroflexota bacterium]